MGNLLITGVWFVLFGLMLLALGGIISEQTVIAYYRLTGMMNPKAKKLNYVRTRIFYFYLSIALIAMGIMIILVNTIRFLGGYS